MKDIPLITTIGADGIATLTMNRPQLRNAFDEDLINRICDEMGRLSTDESIRIIVLTGSGDVFCAGADLNMMQRVSNYSASENRDDARRLGHMLSAINNSKKPTIARVNGPAMGGGVGLIAACDIAIGVENAFFAFSEVRVGLIPAMISPFILQAISPRRARRYFLTGERFDAECAFQIELLHRVVASDRLDEAIDELCDTLLTCAPNAITESKKLIDAVKDRPIDEKIIDETAKRIAGVRSSSEGREGISAFLEKRKPSWVKDK